MKKSPTAYRREMYETILTETFVQGYCDVCELNEASGLPKDEAAGYIALAKNMFQEEVLKPMMNETIEGVHKKLMATGNFQVRQMSLAALTLANETVENIRAEGAEVPETVELADHEKEVLAAIKDASQTDEDVKRIRNSIVDALMKEEENAKEIQEVINLAKQDADDSKSGADIANECVIDRPRNLMHAIITNVTKDFLSENATAIAESKTGVGQFLQLNKETVKDYAKGVYAIFECVQGFGWRQYTDSDIRTKTQQIYKK